MKHSELAMIRLYPEDKAELEKRAHGESLTHQANFDLAMYHGLLDALEPTMRGRFSEAEAGYLCDLFNSTLMEPRFLPSWPEMMAHEVEDGARLDRLDDKWKVDAKTLAGKVGALTIVEALWLWDRIRLFWREPNPMHERIKKIFS